MLRLATLGLGLLVSSAVYANPPPYVAGSACGQGDLDQNCQVKSSAPAVAAAQASADSSIKSLIHDDRGHSMTTTGDGKPPVDAGIPNTRGNALPNYLTTTSPQRMILGAQLGIIRGSADVSSLTVCFPPNAQDGDYVKLQTSLNIALVQAMSSDCTTQAVDLNGNTFTPLPLSAYAAQVFIYNGPSAVWMLAQRAALQGPKGDTGATGSAGTPGANGAQGIQGLPGIAGSPGANGSQGLQGTAGVQGVQGPKGDTGATGTAGLAGTNGTNGAQGPKGDTGATGLAGANGTNGTNGSNGAQGIQGIQGLVGTTGATGPAGSNGTNGAQGIQGIQGITGVTGAAGPTCATQIATSTSYGCIKSPMTVFRTTTAISGTVNYLAVAALVPLPVVTYSVPGVLSGDFVIPSYGSTPPTNIVLTGCNAIATGSVQCTFISSGVLALGSTIVPLQFEYER